MGSDNVPTWFWWLWFAAAIVGHFGLYLSIYNRLNAFGFPRRRIKQTEWVLLITCLLTPLGLAWRYGDFLNAVVWGRPHWSDFPSGLYAYTLVCLATWIYPGIGWLWTRPIFGFQRLPVAKRVQHVDVQQAVAVPLALSAKCRFQSRWPMNQIFQLSIEEKQLPVRGLPAELDGLKIAHLSDIHLTGHIASDFFQYAVERANEWQPDMMMLTGDIVDYDRCIDWLEPCFGHARAPHGRFFVLGNHDTRVCNPADVRAEMTRIGWQDVGSRVLDHSIGKTAIRLLGNEAPWFPAPPASASPSTPPTSDFRIAVCHSPDRIGWARRQGVALMLAGHTHGGQGRLPLAGPLLSPSFHGSRFASGEFYLAPTTMHVSRGLSGVHLLRLRCPPELALLVLRCVPS